MALAHIVVTLFLAAAAQAAVAATPSDRAGNRFENRLARQDDRIDRGLETGRISSREAEALNRQQAALNRAVERQSADRGRLSAREAYRLESRFDRSSRAIKLASARLR